jgi:hypothetical protein
MRGRGSSVEEWVRQLSIGDWLVDGKSHYGDGLYKEAERIIGKSQSELMKFKSIAERFEILLRSKNLAWNHYYEIASLKLIEEDKKVKILLRTPMDSYDAPGCEFWGGGIE